MGVCGEGYLIRHGPIRPVSRTRFPCVSFRGDLLEPSFFTYRGLLCRYYDCYLSFDESMYNADTGKVGTRTKSTLVTSLQSQEGSRNVSPDTGRRRRSKLLLGTYLSGINHSPDIYWNPNCQ